MCMKIIKEIIPYDTIYIIPLGDIHIEDEYFTEKSEKKLKEQIEWVRKRKNARVFLTGDIFNVATRISKTSPFSINKRLLNKYDGDQMAYAIDLLNPIKDKIIGAIDGNHEQRTIDFNNRSWTTELCGKLSTKEREVKYCSISCLLFLKIGKPKKDGENRSAQTYSGYIHHCFDDKTEIFTDNGWRKYNELKENDNVMTMNLDNGGMEWNNINGIYIYDDFDKMIAFKGKNYDLMVSEDHTLIQKSRRNGEFKKNKAITCLNKDNNFPCSGNNFQDEYNIDDNLLKLLAWVITEGTTFKGRKYEVRITQNESGLNHILNLIDKLSKKYEVRKNVRLKYKKGFCEKLNFNRNEDSYEIYINKCELGILIRNLIPDKKIPKFALKFSKRQFDIFLNELILGDGTRDKRKNTKSFSYSQKDENEIDMLQALCAMNGYRTVKGNSDGCFRLSILPILSTRIKKEKVKLVEYNGKAWCVSVKNKTLLVRRNGRVIITGNTTGGGKTPGSKINRVDELRKIIAGCDFYIGGHNHMEGGVKTKIFVPNNNNCTLTEIRQMEVDAGGFLDYGGYPERLQLAPVDIGAPRIRFDGIKKEINLSM